MRWQYILHVVAASALITCGRGAISESTISDIAACTDPAQCDVPTDVLFRLIDAYIESENRIPTGAKDIALQTLAHRRDTESEDAAQIREILTLDYIDVIGDESQRRRDILRQLIAEADEQYRVGVASPADALVGFWLDVSQRVNTTLNSGYHLMPNGYFVHTLFGGTPTNYAGSWGRWEVTGDELVLHYRTLIFIEESVSRLEPVDDVVRIPTSNLRDRDGDDPPAFSGRFPFPHAIGQGRMMQELPLVEYLRTSNLGLWEGAPSIVPSEYEDLRQLRRTVWQTNFDAERGAFIELPFER